MRLRLCLGDTAGGCAAALGGRASGAAGAAGEWQGYAYMGLPMRLAMMKMIKLMISTRQ